jgi:glycosyltransferase involved in cell wall biosynthesis
MNTTNQIDSTNPIDTIFLSIVIPVFNEEDNVRILYREIRDSVDRIDKPYEIIFVDDGSCDNTFAEALRIAKEDPGLKIIFAE